MSAETRPVKNPRNIIPLALAVFGLLVMAVSALLLLQQNGFFGGDGPRLQVDKTRVDLGDVKLDQTVEVTFELTNRGNQPLRLLEQPYVEVAEGC